MGTVCGSDSLVTLGFSLRATPSDVRKVFELPGSHSDLVVAAPTVPKENLHLTEGHRPSVLKRQSRLNRRLQVYLLHLSQTAFAIFAITPSRIASSAGESETKTASHQAYVIGRGGDSVLSA